MSIIEDGRHSLPRPFVFAREEQTSTREIVRSVAVEFMLMIQYFFSRKDINFTLHSSIMKIRCKCDRQVLRSRSLSF